MPVMTSLRMLDGTKRDGSPVVVTIGRSVTSRAVLMIGDTAAELDANATLGLIISASEVLRPAEIVTSSDRTRLRGDQEDDRGQGARSGSGWFSDSRPSAEDTAMMPTAVSKRALRRLIHESNVTLFDVLITASTYIWRASGRLAPVITAELTSTPVSARRYVYRGVLPNQLASLDAQPLRLTAFEN